MLATLWKEQLKNKEILIWLIIFIFVLALYLMMDILAQGSLLMMVNNLGIGIFILHLMINIILALITSSMLSLSQIKLRLTRNEPRGANTIPVLSFLFALFTFGCTPCVIAFLAAIGIAFVPIVFPAGNLLWKIFLLLLMILAMIYMLYSLNKGACPVKTKNEIKG